MVVEARSIRSKKLREHHNREGYGRSLTVKIVEWDGDNVKHMLEQVKWVESASKVCGSVRVGGNNPKSVQWNEDVKAAFRRKEGAWKEVLAVNDKEAK